MDGDNLNLESNQNYRLSCPHFHDQSTILLFGHWMSHTHSRSSSIQWKTPSPSHCQQLRWTPEMYSIQKTSIARETWCCSSQPSGCTMYPGIMSWIVNSPLQHTKFDSENQSCRSLPQWYGRRSLHYTPIQTEKASLSFNIAMIVLMS